MIRLELPPPPTVNTYWRHVRTQYGDRTLISEKGRKFRTAVSRYCLANGIREILEGPLQATIDFYPPDRRRRDLDNYFKACFDALECAGVYENDSQIKRIIATMHEPTEGGLYVVELSQLRGD